MKQFVLRRLFVTGLVLFSVAATGQNQKATWDVAMKSPVQWQKVTPLGYLVVSTANGLAGINTETGAELWSLPALKNCPESSCEPVSKSPFITATAADKSTLYILDPFDGKVVFNSADAGLQKVTDRYFLYRNNSILVIGTAQGGKSTELVMVSMDNGKKLWSKSGSFSFTTGVKDLDNDAVLLTSAFFASKLKASTGEELWKTPIDPRTAKMAGLLGNLEGLVSKNVSKEEVMAQLITPEDRPDIFLIAAQKKNESTRTDSKGAKQVTVTYSSVFMAFDMQTGEYRWPAIVELKQPLGICFAANNGLIACSSQSGAMNMLSYEDGSGMLGKKGNGLNLKGAATAMAPLDERILIASSSGSNSFVTILDAGSGQLLFDKAAKIKGTVSYMEVLPNVLLIGTDEAVNLLNASTGEWTMEDALEGGAGLVTSNDDFVYAFDTRKGILFRMGISESVMRPVSTKPVEFQGKEKPQVLEQVPNGYLVRSDQNLALFNKEGDLTFINYFPAPSESGFRKALLIASAVRAAYYSAAYASYSAAFGSAAQSIQVKDAQSRAGKEISSTLSREFAEASATGSQYASRYLKMAQARFKATRSAQEYMLIMTAESKKDIRLLEVSKNDGSTMAKIPLGKDKDPVYDVDLVAGKLYYLSDNGHLVCYTL
jgi:outer membrane protein assembly factor BamB